MNPDTNSQNVPSGSSTTFSLKKPFFFQQATRSLQHEMSLHNQLRLRAPRQLRRIIPRRRFNGGSGEQLTPTTTTTTTALLPPLPCTGFQPRASPPLPPQPRSQLLCNATAATMGHCRFVFSAFCCIVQLCCKRKKKTAERF